MYLTIVLYGSIYAYYYYRLCLALSCPLFLGIFGAKAFSVFLLLPFALGKECLSGHFLLFLAENCAGCTKTLYLDP